MQDNRLKRVRGALGITQKQLAEAISGDISHVGKIEIGQSKLTPAFVRRVVKALPRVNADFLLTGAGEPLLPEPEETPEEHRAKLIAAIQEVLDLLEPPVREVVLDAVRRYQVPRHYQSGGENPESARRPNLAARRVA